MSKNVPPAADVISHPRRSFYGVDIGVILLDGDGLVNPLLRPVGDVGNARTFDFPVTYTTARGADPNTVIEHNADGLLSAFADAGRDLLGQGVRAVSTSCGFTAIHQRVLADELGGLVATSSLLQVPLALRMLGGHQQLGVITANATTLTDEHLRGVGIADTDRHRLHLIGMESTEHLYQVLVTGKSDLDTARATQEILDLATHALSDHSNIAAFVLECANLGPYATALRLHTGLPVWDITTLLTWIQHGLS